jgi:predicted transcriptional regulator
MSYSKNQTGIILDILKTSSNARQEITHVDKLVALLIDDYSRDDVGLAT